MHKAAFEWVAACVERFGLHGDVLEFGGRNINGSVRPLVPHDFWVSVDAAKGLDVDVVADAATVEVEPGTWDVVICTEVFEHTPAGKAITANALRHLRDGGVFVATMAGPGRDPHSATGTSNVGDEHYANVEPDELASWLYGFDEFEVDQLDEDVRCWARR